MHPCRFYHKSLKNSYTMMHFKTAKYLLNVFSEYTNVGS